MRRRLLLYPLAAVALVGCSKSEVDKGPHLNYTLKAARLVPVKAAGRKAIFSACDPSLRALRIEFNSSDAQRTTEKNLKLFLVNKDGAWMIAPVEKDYIDENLYGTFWPGWDDSFETCDAILVEGDHVAARWSLAGLGMQEGTIPGMPSAPNGTIQFDPIPNESFQAKATLDLNATLAANDLQYRIQLQCSDPSTTDGRMSIFRRWLLGESGFRTFPAIEKKLATEWVQASPFSTTRTSLGLLIEHRIAEFEDVQIKASGYHPMIVGRESWILRRDKDEITRIGQAGVAMVPRYGGDYGRRPGVTAPNTYRFRFLVPSSIDDPLGDLSMAGGLHDATRYIDAPTAKRTFFPGEGDEFVFEVKPEELGLKPGEMLGPKQTVSFPATVVIVYGERRNRVAAEIEGRQPSFEEVLKVIGKGRIRTYVDLKAPQGIVNVR
ncbi:MAG: hypothetical protein JST35_10850 [Armatimonadetes bacterium]|nr:hypothetical protein [Armatimonadota bacterium]